MTFHPTEARVLVYSTEDGWQLSVLCDGVVTLTSGHFKLEETARAYWAWLSQVIGDITPESISATTRGEIEIHPIEQDPEVEEAEPAYWVTDMEEERAEKAERLRRRTYRSFRDRAVGAEGLDLADLMAQVPDDDRPPIPPV